MRSFSRLASRVAWEHRALVVVRMGYECVMCHEAEANQLCRPLLSVSELQVQALRGLKKVPFMTHSAAPTVCHGPH